MTVAFSCTVLLFGCESPGEKSSDVLSTLNELHGSASGALSTVRDGFSTVVETGKMVKDQTEAVVEDVADRVEKVREGVGLVHEGLTGE